MRTTIRIRSRIPFDPMEHKSTSLAVHILLSLSELFLSHLSHQFTLSLSPSISLPLSFTAHTVFFVIIASSKIASRVTLSHPTCLLGSIQKRHPISSTDNHTAASAAEKLFCAGSTCETKQQNTAAQMEKRRSEREKPSEPESQNSSQIAVWKPFSHLFRRPVRKGRARKP